MPKVLLVAWREFRSTVFTRAFIIGAFVLPLVFYGVLTGAAVLGLFNRKVEALTGTVAIADTTPGSVVAQRLAPRLTREAFEQRAKQERERALAFLSAQFGDALPEEAREQALQRANLAVRGEAPDVTLEILPEGADLEAQKQAVLAGEKLALVVVGPDSIPPGGAFELSVGRKVRADFVEAIEDAVGDSVVDTRLADAGVDPLTVRTLWQRPTAKKATLTSAGEAKGGDTVARIVPFVFLMLLAMGIFTGGSYLLMSTIEEKSSRVMEVLLSSVSPMQLMTGKIIGHGLVGLLLLTVYAATGLFAAYQFNVLSVIPPSTLAWLLVYFVVGYFIFAAMFAAIGAAVTEIREAQSLQGPLMGGAMLLIYLGIFAVIGNPNSPLAQVLSFVPPATPFVMSMRISQIGNPPPMWQVVGSTAFAIVFMVALMWAAAKIFRIGVLMYGKPPTLKVLLNWLKQA